MCADRLKFSAHRVGGQVGIVEPHNQRCTENQCSENPLAHLGAISRTPRVDRSRRPAICPSAMQPMANNAPDKTIDNNRSWRQSALRWLPTASRIIRSPRPNRITASQPPEQRSTAQIGDVSSQTSICRRTILSAVSSWVVASRLVGE